jgi:signal peptidase I
MKTDNFLFKYINCFFVEKKKSVLKRIWHFIWEEDSVWSWIVNIILAFLIIKFLFYPAIGLALGTNHPIVAVISESMEHKTTPACMEVDSSHSCIRYYPGVYVLCNTTFRQQYKVTDTLFWESCGSFYLQHNITQAEFEKFPFSRGFNKGDLIILRGKKPADIRVGDIVVYSAGNFEPIIHRVIAINATFVPEQNKTAYYFTTKGDHNPDSIIHDLNFPQENVLGAGLFRIPYLGYIKIWFVDYLLTPIIKNTRLANQK